MTLQKVLLIIALTIVTKGYAQIENYLCEDYIPEQFNIYSTYKIIPEHIKPQVLFALSHYPELKNTRIIFREKETLTPLTSRPRFFHTFKRKGHRTYIITISTKTSKLLDPILFKSLPFNAQVGVIGHELAHIVEYIKKSSFQILGIALGQLKSNYVDTFEYATDKRTIEHGLGYQLLSWSTYVRENLNIDQWHGSGESSEKVKLTERYMNPNTIKEIMKTHDY